MTPTDHEVARWAEECHAFARLIPEPIGGGKACGTLDAIALGSMAALKISATPQRLRRTRLAARREPFDVVKLSIPSTPATIQLHDDRQISIEPGQMLLYDLGQPYDYVHVETYSAMALTFPRESLPVPHQILDRSLCRLLPADRGPGAVLTALIRAAVHEGASLAAVGARVGDAALHLIAGALGARLPDIDAAGDAQRISVLQYVHAHLAEPDLSHDRIAAAHRMSPRTLHRLFEHEPYTVAEYIRLRRLDAARRELTDPLFRHRSIASIAARWGFVSPAHFSRIFQARYGVPPSAIR